jgi:transposase-like protein
MSKRKRRVFSREFKLSAVQRMIAGERRAFDAARRLFRAEYLAFKGRTR